MRSPRVRHVRSGGGLSPTEVLHDSFTCRPRRSRSRSPRLHLRARLSAARPRRRSRSSRSRSSGCVVYRNGVAYFERAGHVDEGEVRFKMKQSEVGDFLATLAVMEQGGSSVRAAAFPLDVDDDVRKDDEDKDAKKPPLTEDEKRGPQKVAPLARREGARDRGRLHRVGAGVEAVVPARGAPQAAGRSAVVGHRREPVRRGLEEHPPLARRRSAARVRGAARDGGDSRRGPP